MNGELSRSRYGDASLWTLRRNLGGTRARLLYEKLELYFSEERRPLILDLREAGFVDSRGADLLERARRRHPSFAVVGLPRDYETLPLPIRVTLSALLPAGEIGEALATLQKPSRLSARWDTRRQHNRFTVMMPVEITVGTLSTAATLRDLSLGGTRIGRISSRWVRELRAHEDSTPQITISGLQEDPLGKEVAARYRSAVLVSTPVHVLPNQAGLGVCFSAPPPASFS